MGLFKTIIEDFQNVKNNDPALVSRFELFFNYPGLWALLFYRISHLLFTKRLRVMARMLSGLGQFLTGVDIHPGAQIGRRVFIDHAIGVVIGETAIVGNDVVIYQQVTLGGVSLKKGKRHPTVEDGVTIGAGSKILGDITIGKDAKIGANSVVIKDVPPDSTAVGIPAHVTKRIDNKEPLKHNVMPDIDKDLFNYLLDRIELLENALETGELDKEREEKLKEQHKMFIDTMKE
jgi:serine O-acetyltransferase